ncbi:ribonuclease H-like domain-containing protein [Tanacetum coccineum]
MVCHLFYCCTPRPYVSAASTPTGANAGESSFVYLGGKIPIDASTLPNADLPIDLNMPDLEDDSDAFSSDGIFNGAYDDENVGAVVDFNNTDDIIHVSPIPTLRNLRNLSKRQILGDLKEPKNISEALQDESWGKQCKRNCCSSNYKRFGYLLICHLGKRQLAQWVLKNKRDKRSIVVKKPKPGLVAQGFDRRRIDYDEMFKVHFSMEQWWRKCTTKMNLHPGTGGSRWSRGYDWKVVKERDELKLNIEKWEESSKNLDELLNSQMSARDKSGLGYDTQLNEMSNNSETDSEISLSIFDVRSSDEENTLANDRKINEANTQKPKTVYESVNSDKVIIGDWNSDDEDDVSEVWRPKGNYLDHVSKDSRSFMLKKVEYVGPKRDSMSDHAVVDSGCSSHMTGNKAYLSDYEDYNGGFVAFGSDPKGDELSFKLLDKSQVVLRAPRKDDVYNLDLKNIVPSGGITCLYANATADESKLWHRRLGHVNFKNINKLVKGYLVRGSPSKVFVNDHTCVACKKGKQHKASLLTRKGTVGL